jgi:hypothetical protein
VLWRNQANEIEMLRAKVRSLRGEIAAQQAAFGEMDTLVERMVHCDSLAQMQFVLRRTTTIAGRRKDTRNWFACTGARRKHRIDCSPSASSPVP